MTSSASPTRRAAWRSLGWLLVGIGLVGCWWKIRGLGDVRLQLPAFYGWFALAFGLYLAGLWLARRSERVPAPPLTTGASLGIILVIAGWTRALLLPTAPTLSDDIYRYLWDGRVQLHGIDPYAYAPNDPRLTFLQDEQFSRINFPHLRTVYPPMTQLAFRLGASLGGSLTAHKLVFVGAELLVIGSALFILWRRKQSLLWVAAYAWHPLVILEIAGSGHNDALGIAMLWLGVAAWEARRWGAASVAWAAAFLSKFTSLLLVPWWWARRSHRRWLVVFLLVSLLPLAGHPTVLSALVESLGAMATRFESNASLYLVLVWVTRSMVASRVLAAGLGVGFLVWWARRQSDPIRFCVGAFTVAALLSPVLHPWYVVWLVPCFCFVRSPALVLLTGTVVLAYTVWPGRLADGRWVIPVWAHVLEYVPVCLLGMWELWSKRSCVWASSFRLATKPRLSVRF